MQNMIMGFIFLPMLLMQSFMASLAMSQPNFTTDQFALLEFKAHIISDPLNIMSSNWSSATSVCNWVGVSCGALHRRVTTLDLPNMNLTGSLLPHLGNLSFLVYLDLSGNNFHGHLPPELRRLQRLRFMDLSVNFLSGTIPDEIWLLSKLEVFRVRDNLLTGTISRNIGNLTKLRRLSIGDTDVRGEIPQEIGDLHNLEIISAENAILSGPIPPNIFNISSLRWISLYRNDLSGTLPIDLCYHLPNLEWLYLSFNQLNGSIPSSIGSCRKLQSLVLPYNRFTGYIPSSIGNLTELIEIYLGDNELEGEIPTEVGNLLNLETLSIGHTVLTDVPRKKPGLTGIVPPTIYNISSLRFIYLANNSLSGSIPEDLCQRLPMLYGYIFANNNLTGTIPKDIGNCTFLNLLNIGENFFTGKIPEEVGNLPLGLLHMGTNYLTGSIPHSIFNISTLVAMNLEMNNLSGHLPSTFGRGLPNLTTLYLNNNKLNGIIPSSICNSSLLTDIELNRNSFSGPFPNSLGYLRFLEYLTLEDNNLSSEFSTPEKSFLSSLTNCRFLTHIIISFNPLNGILPASIGNLSTSLQYLSASNCKIKGNIPVEVGNLSNLIDLDLQINDLTGPIPATIGKLQQLQDLGFGGNRLKGTIPNDICHLERLYRLTLSYNQLNGSMPECLANLTSLRTLGLNSNQLSSNIPLTFWSLQYILQVNLSSNSFSGPLPLEFRNLKVLSSMDLSRNQLSGNLPSSIGDLKDLSHLSLAANALQGNIPQSFDGLINLEFLDLSNNLLSGVIPKSLERLSYLKFFNVSFNRLQGEIPSRGSFRNFSAKSFMGNTALCGLPRFQVPPCKSNSSSQSHKKFIHVLRSILPPIATTILILTLLLIFKRRRNSKAKSTNEDALQDPTKWRRISYQELQQATERFSERNLLGKGSFGSVYSGILQDGMTIAIKVFNLQAEDALRNFDTECEVLRSIRHRNLIKTISSCCNEDFKALVLEFMPNGTLEKWLYSDRFCVDLLQRVNIMIDVALAVEYLHHGHPIPIIHCDLKPSNVLLDEDMVAHVGDFGLAKLLGEGESVMQTMRIATIGYMAPEYGSLGMVSAKGDVYSYGILLMETFARRKPTDELFTGEISLKLWVRESLSYSSAAEIVDANLVKKEEKHYVAKINCVTSIMELALDCCAESPRERPNMMDVAAMLKKIKEKYLKDVGARRVH